jgi:hypothetical protein
MSNCCDEYGNCNQGRDCPVRVATYRPVMRAADPLPPSIWRHQLKRLGYWMLMAILGLTIWPLLAYAVLS